jgi:hypothetical protein
MSAETSIVYDVCVVTWIEESGQEMRVYPICTYSGRRSTADDDESELGRSGVAGQVRWSNLQFAGCIVQV